MKALLGEGAINCASEFLGTDHFKKILVISHLPKREEAKKEALNYLKSLGIDEIITFKEILQFLIKKVDPNKYYKDDSTMYLLGRLKQNSLLKGKY